MIVTASAPGVPLSRPELDALREPVARSVADWLEREREDYLRHENPAPGDGEGPIYLSAGDLVEKFRPDQDRDERGRWAVEGGASDAALRAGGWRRDFSESAAGHSGYTSQSNPGDAVLVRPDGSWRHVGPWENYVNTEGNVRPTLAHGGTARELHEHLGGVYGEEEIPTPPRDLVGARPLDQRDVAPSEEDLRWLEEIEKHPDVARAMEATRTGMPTDRLHRGPDGGYTPERRALHEQIAEEMLKPGAARRVGQQKTAILIIGPPGAGKTTTLGLVLRKPEQFSVISADYAKERLPEYDGYNSSLVHEESTEIAEHVALLRAIQRNHNIVLDATGKTSAKYEGYAEKLHKLGYNVQALHVDVPTIVAARRVVDRFLGMKAAGQVPRFSEPRRVLLDTDAKPTATYENLKARGLLSRAMEFNSDGPEGSLPRKVEDIDYTRRRAAKRDGAAGRDDAPRGAPGGGDRPDAGRGAGDPQPGELAGLIARAVADALSGQGPRVARTVVVEKVVERGPDNRISRVVERHRVEE